MEIIQSAGYAGTMERVVLPFMEARKESGSFARVPGQDIVWEHFPCAGPRGAVVMLHGFSEAIPKLYETAWYFLQNGYSVWMIQQREHGLSYRSTSDPSLIYLEHFQDLVEDLHCFLRKIVLASPETKALPLVLFGHSMGGGVSTCFLEKYPKVFGKAVLSSPMLEMNTGSIPVPAAEAYARMMILLGKGKNPMPGSEPFQDAPDFDNSCTTCRERYDYWFGIQRIHPEYQMCIPAVRTAQELLNLTRFAERKDHIDRIRADVLLLQAGLDTMVKPGGQEKLVRQLGKKGRLVKFPKAKHEIYREKDEILRKYWDTILEFLA